MAAKYVTLLEFRERYGERELVRATNDRTSAVGVAVEEGDLREYIDGDVISPTEGIEIIVGAFERARLDAQAEMDSYLTGQYAVPFDEEADVPAAVRSFAAPMVRFNLYRLSRPVDVVRDMEAARMWLRDVGRRVRLDADASGSAPSVQGGPAVAAKADTAGTLVSTAAAARYLDPT